MSDAVLEYALNKRASLIEELKELVACPSVGADPAMADGMEKARQLIEQKLDQMGFQENGVIIHYLIMGI